MSRKSILLFVLAALLLLTAAIPAGAQELPTLRIAILPVLNTLPLHVAQAEGFYAEEGVNVELIPFDSARDRQIALQTGEVEGANTDLQGVILLVNGGFDVRAVRSEPTLEPYFSIVAGANSGVETIDDLRGVPIAISENTIIEYLTTEMLLNAGFSPDEIVYEEVPAIPVRLELLNTGQVAAATLPEPLTTLAVNLQGGRLIANDGDAAFVPTVLAFNGAVLDEQPDAVRAFLAAYERAVAAINSNPEAYRDVMNANINIPAPLQATFPVPTFPIAGVPTEDQTALVQDWMVSAGLIPAALPYESLVDGSFLPALTLLQAASGTPQFSVLVEVITTAGVQDTLSVGGPYTIFAPTNDAFALVPPAVMEGLMRSMISLQSVLAYHVVSGVYTAADLAEMDGEQLTTLLGQPLVVTVADDGSILLNGQVPVVRADIVAADGVIHAIGGVLLPQRP